MASGMALCNKNKKHKTALCKKQWIFEDRYALSHTAKKFLVSLWLYKENKLRIEKKKYLLYIFPPERHTLTISLF
jgi:hypothetical protein